MSRTYATKSIHVRSEEGGEERLFQILPDSPVKEGGSVLCYEAKHGTSRKGMLKELFPSGDRDFIRDEKERVIPVPGDEKAAERFRKTIEKYLEPYQTLRKMQESSADLRTFIPDFELFRGQDAKGGFHGTAYVWDPAEKLLTFAERCREIRKDPAAAPEYSVMLILKAIRSLAGCVLALHKRGLVHRDLSPDNFGFKVRNREILTESVTLFDVNTICRAADVPTLPVQGKSAYMDPEARNLLLSEENAYQTDIYAIGVILFGALVLPESGYDFLYEPAEYDRIYDWLHESVLLQASESLSHPRVLSKLAEILRRCLCPLGMTDAQGNRLRYADCAQLMADLDETLALILPSSIGSTADWEPTVLRRALRELEKSRAKNSIRILQYHLSTHPLYRLCPDPAEGIRILVIGCGLYGRTFLDLCLQIAQLPDFPLSITVLSDTAADKEQYLEQRPALSAFFDVDGSLEDETESYGTIRFRTVQFSKDTPAENRRELAAYFSEEACPHQVFIATGDDARNTALAADVRSLLAPAGIPEDAVAYVVEAKRVAEPVAGCIPVLVNGDTKKHPLTKEFERLAFNTHMLWEKQLNVDLDKINRDFRKKYNFDSCISYVLSVQYKLYAISVGTGLFGKFCLRDADFHKLDMYALAEAFQDSGYHIGDRYKKHREALVAAEHRRWLTEKLCQGWTCLDDFTDCMTGSTKNTKQRKHLCIRRSTPGQPLSDGSILHEMWDTMTEKDMRERGLDPLDVLSVRLHQTYLHKAHEIQMQSVLHTLHELRDLVQNDNAAALAFQEWYVCVLAILERNSKKLGLYGALKDTFLDAARAAFPVDRYAAIDDMVGKLHKELYPAIGAAAYRDFKKEDTVLIERLPFLLTYTPDISLFVPFTASDDGTALFQNVAAAARINPGTICYLFHMEETREMELFRRSITAVARFLDKKNLHAALDWIITCRDDGYDGISAPELEKAVKECSPRVRQVRVYPVAEKSEIADIMRGGIPVRGRAASGRQALLAEKNGTSLSFLLESAGFYKDIARAGGGTYIEKDTWNEPVACDQVSAIFRYLPHAFITVADMFSLSHAGSFRSHTPDFSDSYERLWQVYTANTAAWKTLCDTLKSHTARADILASFPQDAASAENGTVEYAYGLPSFCIQAAQKILTCLMKYKILLPGSGVLGQSLQTCRLQLRCRADFRERFDALFQNPYMLMDPDHIHVRCSQRMVNVLFDSLIVTGLPLAADQEAILRFLSENRYISQMQRAAREGGECVSFSFSSHSVKDLLTDAGRMLEVYTFHSCRESRFLEKNFDDVTSGYEVSWGTETGDVSVRSAFDCVLTKGFRTLFVACKACWNIEQDYYYKLACLTRKFGVNTTAVLIADTQEQEWLDTGTLNAMQRARGGMLDVITIWRRDEIAHIGETLTSIADGTYGREKELDIY